MCMCKGTRRSFKSINISFAIQGEKFALKVRRERCAFCGCGLHMDEAAHKECVCMLFSVHAEDKVKQHQVPL